MTKGIGVRITMKLAGLLVAVGCFTTADQASAQCVTGPVVDGRTPVDCEGESPAGYAAPVGIDDIDVLIVEDGTPTVIRDGSTTEAVLINGNSSVINGTTQTTGTVTAGSAISIENAGSVGIRVETGETGSYLQNEGAITAGTGLAPLDNTVGMQIGDGSAVLNGIDGTITLFGDGATGILAGESNAVDLLDEARLVVVGPSLSDRTIKSIENHGAIAITGDGARGIAVGNFNTRVVGAEDFGVWNSAEGAAPATITITGNDGVGIFAGTGNGVMNQGNIIVTGDSGIGIFTGDGNSVVNQGTITTTGNNSRGIEVGDNSTITNAAGAEIHGGSGATGYGIWFNGDDPTETNRLDNFGTIDTGGTVAIRGSDSIELIEFQATSVVTGDLVLGAGDDQVQFDDGAVFEGSIELGAGDDQVFVQAGESLGETAFGAIAINAGDGSDRIIIRGTPGGVETPNGATVAAMVDLGVAEDDDMDLNEFQIRVDSTFNGSVMGGGGVDEVVMNFDATMTGDISLGAEGDSLSMSSNSVLNGDADLGEGANTVVLFSEATVNGNILLGSGADRVEYDPGVTVTGTLNLGDGANVFVLKPTATIPANLVLGAGIDTLQLDAFPEEFATTSTIDLVDAAAFEALNIGTAPDSSDVGFDWFISTSAPVTFTDGVLLQSGPAVFVDTVDITTPVMTQAINSVMVFDLTPADLGVEKLKITGALNITAGSVPPAGPVPERGADVEIFVTRDITEGEYPLITTTGGITGVFFNEIFHETAVISFATVLDANNYTLTVDRHLYAELAATSNQARTGSYLDEVRLDPDVGSFQDDVLDELDLLSERNLVNALGQLHAQTYDAHTSSVLAWGRAQQRVLHERPMHCERFTYSPLPEIVSDSPCGNKRFMPWAKVVGDLSRHKGGEQAGYDTLSGGVLAGVDFRLSESLWFSGDVGFGRIEIEHDNGAEGDVDSIDLGAAAGFVRNGFSARSSLTYSHGFHENTREVDFVNTRLTGKHDSDRVSLAARAGYEAQLGFFRIEPNATLDYTHVEEEKIEEKGDGDIGLDVSARKSDVFVTTAGVRMSTNFLKYRYAGEWLEWADGVWTPSVTAQWRQAFGDVDRDIKSSMQGAPNSAGRFKSKGKDSDGGAEVGARLSFQPMHTATTLEIGYDGYFGDDVTNHAANATVRIPF